MATDNFWLGSPLLGELDEQQKRQLIARALMQGGASVLQGVGQGQPTAAVLGRGAMSMMDSLDSMVQAALAQQQDKARMQHLAEQTNLIRRQSELLTANEARRVQELEQRRGLADQLRQRMGGNPDAELLAQRVLAGDMSAFTEASRMLHPTAVVERDGAFIETGPGGERLAGHRPAGFLPTVGNPLAPAAPATQEAPGIVERIGNIGEQYRPAATLEIGLQQRAGEQAMQQAQAALGATRKALEGRIKELFGGIPVTRGVGPAPEVVAKARISKLSAADAKAALTDLEAGYESASVHDKKRIVIAADLLRKRIYELEISEP